MSKWLIDVESKGKLAFNMSVLETYKDAEAYARKTYYSVLERDVFVAGWNMAYWNQFGVDVIVH